ncbi:hypothetical protein JCM8547_004732 [Rhodosporidiobolus lusitaniae]
MKRLIIGCDGTWQSALYQPSPSNLSNVVRLLTAINSSSAPSPNTCPIPQLKLYVSGPGTGEEVAAGAWHGALGEGVLEKVREVYYWIASNWEEGDEIYLTGFSRGAYIIRLVCQLIDLLGILDPKTNLGLFPPIVAALCSEWNPHKGYKEAAAEMERLMRLIKPKRDEQVRRAEGGLLIKVVGLFDTVPLYHLRQLDPITKIHLSPFGLPDAPLQPTVQSAVHLLAINEQRDAFEPLLWEVPPSGLQEGQQLEQTWLCGVHTDVGGGYSLHDLADLCLARLVSHLEPHLSFDFDYLRSVSAHPAAPWGAMKPKIRPHLFSGHPRPLPNQPSNPQTHEYLHPSILQQDPANLPPSLLPLLQKPDDPIFCELMEWEKELKDEWAVKAVASTSAATAPVPPSPSSSTPPLPAITSSTSPFLPISRTSSVPVPPASTVPPAKDPPPPPTSRTRQREKAILDGLHESLEKMRAAGDSPGLRKGR